MTDVRVTLLGGFGAAVDGVPVPARAWRLKKARELVKLLALAPGHRLHREQAMDALWGERDPSAAANNLHQAVYVARRALDRSAIVMRDEVLTLAAEVDVDLLERAAAQARRDATPSAYRAALSLYTGELLPENRYDDWATARRDELAELAAELADELDELDSAEQELRPSLPAEASSFVGRSRELADLAALLGSTRLLTLVGTGGVGKTRLALELARSFEPADGACAVLVELAGIAEAALVPDAVAAALDLRPLPGQTSVDAVVDFLASRRHLLVVDNCEHLLAATAALADTLLRAGPSLRILATSREPLRVPGEVVFRVPSLAIPDPGEALAPDDLLRYEAVRLFVDRAGAAAPGFALDAQNAPDVARICFRLDGLPLALELAAGRLGALGPAAIAERLDDRFRLLRSTSHASPSRQQTLAATLQWSHDLLEPDERTLFRRLAVFAGGFELRAAERVCDGDGLTAANIADLLGRLVEKSLVAADVASSRERRYHLLDTVRLYARDRLDQEGEAAALADRHADWALALAEQEGASARLDQDAANLRSALDRLRGRRPDDALRLCLALGPFWLRRIDLDEARRRFDETLAAAPARTPLRARALLAAAAIDLRSGAVPHGRVLAEESLATASELGDAQLEWRALQTLGEFGIVTDQPDVATPWLERALALARRERLVAAEAICVYSLGVACWIRGEVQRAEELVAESIALLGSLTQSPERIPSPVNIAEIRTSELRGVPGLRVVFEDTLQPFVEMSCAAAVSYALANQAALVRARGDLDRARALIDESAARFEESGDEAGTAAVLVRRAYLELAAGSSRAAREALEKALALRRRQRDRRGLGLVLAGLGLIDIADGDDESAERHLAEARDIFRRAGDRWGLASSLWRTADLAVARGDLDGADAALREARAVLGATRRERWIATTLAGLAEVARLRGDVEGASALLADARERYASCGDARGVTDTDERLAELLSGR